MTFNIQYGKGRDGRYDIGRSAATIAEADADIIGLQEIEAYWDRSGNVHQVEEIARRMPAYHSVFGPTIDLHKNSPAPDSKPVRRQFGNAIFSRYPIIASRAFLFPRKLNPLNVHSIQRGVIEATIDTPLGLLRAYTTHLSHVCEGERLEQARFIMDLHRNAVVDGPAATGDHPDASWLENPPPQVPDQAILMGDFNAVPDSQTYATLTGPLGINDRRLDLPDGFVDAWTCAGHSEQSGPTVYGDFRAKTGVRLDYVLVTPNLTRKVRSAEVLTQTDASDHQALLLLLQ